MVTVKDKILDFVKIQTEPVLSSDIAKGVDCDLATTQRALLELRREGVLVRSLSNGKALYSVNSKDGEGLTPVQAGNARVVQTLNELCGGSSVSSDKETTEDADEETHRPFDIKLSFNQGKRLKLEDYSIGIPDGFEYKTNVNGRDFAVWMPPTEDPDMLDSDGIPIMSPIVLMENPKVSKSQSEEISRILLKKALVYCYASAWLENDVFGTVPEVLDTQKIYAVYHKTLMSNYSVNLIFNKYVKALTLRVDPEIDPEDNAERTCLNLLLASWIDTIELCDPYPVRKSLDNPEFFKSGVSKSAISEWGKYADEWSNQYTFLCTQAIQYEIYKYNATHPVWSFTACKSKLLPYLEKEASDYNKLLAEVLSCLEKINGTCPDDVFLFLCNQALNIAKIDECARNLDNDSIIIKTNAPQVRAKIKEISRPIEQKAKDAERSRKETEEKKISELKVNAEEICLELKNQLAARLDEEKQRAASALQNSILKLEKTIKSETERLQQEITETREEINSATHEFNSLGLFRFQQKKEINAKIDALQKQVERLAKLLQDQDTPDIRSEKERVAYYQKRFDSFPEKREAWESKVEKACNEYKGRVEIHCDYLAGKKLNLASQVDEETFEKYHIMKLISAEVGSLPTIMEAADRLKRVYKIEPSQSKPLINYMIRNNYISRTHEGRLFYGDEHLPELIDDRKWDATKPPEAPELDIILGLKR